MQTLFITGATRGIGRETALLFARRGWRVFGCGRDEQKIDEVNAELALVGATPASPSGMPNSAVMPKGEAAPAPLHEIFRMDVTKPDEINRGMARLMEATGGNGPDVLVNNAGYQELCPVEDLSLDGWRNQFETNVLGYLAMIQRLVPKMRERKRGRIVNLSSIAGRVTFPVYGAYSASKHAIEAISDALRMELKPFGVKVVIVEPGPIISNINITGFANLAKNRPAQTAYGKLYDDGPRRLAGIESAKVSYPTSMAAEVIYKAATASRPRQRYGVTRIWWLVVFTKKFLPGWMQDRIFAGV